MVSSNHLYSLRIFFEPEEFQSALKKIDCWNRESPVNYEFKRFKRALGLIVENKVKDYLRIRYPDLVQSLNNEKDQQDVGDFIWNDKPADVKSALCIKGMTPFPKNICIGTNNARLGDHYIVPVLGEYIPSDGSIFARIYNPIGYDAAMAAAHKTFKSYALYAPC